MPPSSWGTLSVHPIARQAQKRAGCVMAADGGRSVAGPSAHQAGRPGSWPAALLGVRVNTRELNASQLGREIGISPHTAREWLDVLIQSFQVQRIDAFSTNATKRVSGRPKLHLVDTGFAAWLASISSPLALQSHPMFGALFESYVVGELSRQATTLATPPQRWHWRSAGGAEVDLLLERDGVFHLIEVKLTSRPSRRDTSGLRAFAESYPGLRLGHRVVVHGGPDLERLDEVTVAVPVGWV